MMTWLGVGQSQTLGEISMKRSIATMAMAVAIGAATIPAGPLSAQAFVDGPKVTWNVSNWGGPGRENMVGLEDLVRRVRERTQGNFTINIAYGEALSPAKENLDGLRLGAFEMALFCAAYDPGKTPTLMGLNLPFLPIDGVAALNRVQLDYFAHPAVVKDLERWRARIFVAAPIPNAEIMGRGKPPMTPEDLKGLRIRTPGGGMAEALKQLGAVPMSMPAPEMYSGLERGVVDGVTAAMYGHMAYKIHEVSNWFTTNLALGSTVCPIAVGIPAWNRLPPQYQALLDELKKPYYELLIGTLDQIEKKVVAQVSGKLTPVTYSPAQIQQILDRGAKPVWDQWVREVEAKGVPGRELVELILSSAKKSAATN
jgi:TRAP-type C4-dicarboxylate transport system substrate-binding protein